MEGEIQATDEKTKTDPKVKKIINENREIMNASNNSMFHVTDKDAVAAFSKTSSLADQMKLVRKWWSEMDENKGRLELPMKIVSDFMTKKGITPDREKAKAIIYKAQIGREKRQLVTLDEFNRIFCKGIFKDALINVVESIDSNGKSNSEALPLSIKISQYQRELMMDGLMKDKNRYEEGKAVLEALSSLKREEDPHYQIDETELRTFVEEPFGKKMKEREVAMRHSKFNPIARKFEDNYLNAINVIEGPTQKEIKNQDLENKFYTAGIDEEVNKTFLQQKRDYLVKEFEENKKYESNKSSIFDADGSMDRPKRPTLMGVASKIINKLQSELPGIQQHSGRKNTNTSVTIPQIYFSTDRQSRLGEESDLLEKFQSVIMHKPFIRNALL